MTERLDLVFDSDGPVPLTFDFFRPSDEEMVPLVVIIHGGGWISGDKSHFTHEARKLAEHGYACACISYRLAPLHPFPCAVADVQNFVRYARKNAHEFGIDKDRMAAIGSSAGGHLASMLGLADKYIIDEDRPELSGESPKVGAVVNLAGLTDLTDPYKNHFQIAWSFIDQFMGCPYEGNETKWKEASPIHHVSKTDAAFLIAHGDADDVVPIEQSVSLHQALINAGVRSKMIAYEGEGHGFSEPVWDLLLDEILAFFDVTLRKENSLV